MNMRNGKEAEAVNGTLNDQSSIYLQIAKMLEDSILRGIYQEGEQVPSTNELARQYSINPATAAKGINLLVAEGVLYKRRGIGMFVAPGATAAVKEKRRKALGEEYVLPLLREAKSLGLSKEELLAMVKEAIEHEGGEKA